MKTRSMMRPVTDAPEDSLGEARDAVSDSTFWEALALAAAAADPAEALESALTELGALYRADRAWLGRYNSALTHFWGASEWVHPSIPSHFQQMQGVPVNLIVEAHRKFLRGETVAIPDVQHLPRQSRGLQAELRRQGVRSTLAYPLVHEGKLIGFFGFDHVRERVAWTPEELRRLPALGKFLAALLHRRLAPDPPPEPSAKPLNSIHITDRGSRRSLPIDDVVFIEAEGDYSRVHMSDGSRYLELRSLRTWIAHLPAERFLRVHRSYLVNGEQIARLDRGSRWTLYLQAVSRPIPVGRAFRHALRLHMGF